MKSGFIRFVCRILVVCVAALPFQAQAVLIGTNEGVAERAAPYHFVERAEVAAQLQAMGLSPQAAQERVAALTDAELVALADRVDRLPAGAFGGAAVGILVVAIFLLWRFHFSDQAQAETGKPGTKPASKPAAKPEAEKK